MNATARLPLRGRPREWLAAALRSRAVLFVIVAALLYEIVPAGHGGAADPDVVRVTTADLQLRELLAQRASANPTDRERLRQEAVEDAILEHEALRLGLGGADLVIRRRLVQKALFLAEDLEGAFREPTEQELRAFHAAHGDRFRLPGRQRFVHVFAHEETTLAELRPAVEHFVGDGPPPFGEAFAFPRSVEATPGEIAERYGDEFAKALATAPEGVWSGPQRSKFGVHLFRVVGRDSERDSAFEEVATHVAFAALVDRRERAIDRFIQRAFNRVRVEVEGQVMTTLTTTHRLAMRDEASAEDGL